MTFHRLQKGNKKTFPHPTPPCNVVRLFELPVENNKHHNFEWRGGGGVWIVLFSEVALFEYNASTILLPIVYITEVTIHHKEN